MILNHEVVVEAPIARVWALLDEVDSVIACMPGASYVGPDGDEHKAGIKVKVGAISANFQGKFRFLDRNEAEHTVLIRGTGKDLGGKASANATITLKLEPQSATRTKALVKTDLALTGPLAQFGGSLIADIASRMIGQFTENLNNAVAIRPVEGGPDQQQVGTEAPAVELGGVLARHGLHYAAVFAGILVLAGLIVSFFRT